MKLETNLNHAFEDSRKLLGSVNICARIVIGGLLVLVGLGAAVLVGDIRRDEALLAGLAEESARLAKDAGQLSEQEIEAFRQRVAFCNELIAFLNDGPGGLLDLLGDALPRTCRVTSLRFNAEQRVCLIELESGSAGAVNEFFSRLKDFSAVEKAMIISQASVSREGVRMIRTSCQLRLAEHVHG